VTVAVFAGGHCAAGSRHPKIHSRDRAGHTQVG
jgi:hypothetical protein